MEPLGAARNDPSTSERSPEEPVFHRLEPGVRIAWLLSGVIRTAILTAVLMSLDFFWLSREQRSPLPPGMAGASLSALLLLQALIMPWFEYRAWRYAIRAHDVLMRFGVLWRVQRSVPRLRIQHMDIRSGPIDRTLGLASLIIYTAGSGDADARIPGLTPLHAEALREMLLRSEPVHG